METQIAIETSMIIKASTEIDSMQSLVTLFIAPSVATAREREKMHFGCLELTHSCHVFFLTLGMAGLP